MGVSCVVVMATSFTSSCHGSVAEHRQLKPGVQGSIISSCQLAFQILLLFIAHHRFYCLELLRHGEFGCFETKLEESEKAVARNRTLNRATLGKSSDKSA